MKFMLKKFILYVYIAQIAIYTETEARVGALQRKTSNEQMKRKSFKKKTNRKKLTKKIAKIKKIAQSEKSIGLIAINDATMNQNILKTAKDASLNGLSKTDIIALAVDVASNMKSLHMSQEELDLQNQIGNDGLDAICQIIAWFSSNKNFSGNSFSTLVNDKAEVKAEVENTIAENENTLEEMLADNPTIALMKEHPDLILDMIEKVAASIVIENSQPLSFAKKVKNIFSWGSGKWHLNRDITKYNRAISQMVIQHPVNIEQKNVRLLAAHMVLLGTHLFRPEIERMFQSFFTSPFFKNFAIVLSASAEITSSDAVTAEAERLNLEYQKATKESLTHLANLLHVKIDYTKFILSPYLQPTPWYLSPISISLALAGASILAEATYLGYQGGKEAWKKKEDGSRGGWSEFQSGVGEALREQKDLVKSGWETSKAQLEKGLQKGKDYTMRGKNKLNDYRKKYIGLTKAEKAELEREKAELDIEKAELDIEKAKLDIEKAKSYENISKNIDSLVYDIY